MTPKEKVLRLADLMERYFIYQGKREEALDTDNWKEFRRLISDDKDRNTKQELHDEIFTGNITADDLRKAVGSGD